MHHSQSFQHLAGLPNQPRLPLQQQPALQHQQPQSPLSPGQPIGLQQQHLQQHQAQLQLIQQQQQLQQQQQYQQAQLLQQQPQHAPRQLPLQQHYQAHPIYQSHQSLSRSQKLEEAKRFLQSTTSWFDNDDDQTPPQPPPRRRSSISLANSSSPSCQVSNENKFPLPFYASKSDVKPSNNSVKLLYPNGQHDKLKEIHELAFNSPGRVKEHAQKLNKMASESELKPPMPIASPPTPAVKLGGRSKDSTKEEDNDSASVQPFDPLKRKWLIVTSNCDYNEMVSLLKKDLTLAGLKDFTSGYTALHWAAKFGKPEIIKLIAGTHGVNVNKKSHGGYTPLHLAAIHKHENIMELLKIYGGDTSIRDHSGKLAEHYFNPRSPLRATNSSNSSSSLRSKQSNGSLNGSQHKHSGSSNSHTKLSDKGRSESSSSAFIRIGSLNKMRKTAAAIKGIKSWGSSESVSDSNTMPPPKSSSSSKKKRNKKTLSSPPMDKIVSGSKDSDSDSAYGF